MSDDSQDVIWALKRELERAERHNAELTFRLQMYSDTLVAISALDHANIQNAVKLARHALTQ